jgi:hypothetical protein
MTGLVDRAAALRRWTASHPVLASVIVAAVALRAFLLLLTPGTYDMQIWEDHARALHELGLLAYYRSSLLTERPFNHPPAIALLVEALWRGCEALGLEFAAVFRLLFTGFDLATAWLLSRLLAGHPRRWLLVGLYLLNPIVFLFSAYHGNTDAAVAFFAVLALLFAARDRYALAGAALGAGVSVKWIVLLVLPPLLLGAPGLRSRLRFLGGVAAAFVAGFGWHLAADPSGVATALFGYTGQAIHTTAGIPVWGYRVLVATVLELAGSPDVMPVLQAILRLNTLVLGCALAAYYALRARARGPLEVGRTMAGGWVIFHALTNFWSFQYLAWAAPLLVFLELPAFLALSAVASLYVGAYYVSLTGSMFLLGPWDFIGHPFPPLHVLLLRDLAIATFLGFAIAGFWRAARDRRGSKVP